MSKKRTTLQIHTSNDYLMIVAFFELRLYVYPYIFHVCNVPLIRH